MKFEYNKDPNGTIYAVMRRDLVPAGSGVPSASRADPWRRRRRPTARRSRSSGGCGSASALYLRDLESGRERALFDKRRQGPAGGVGGARSLSAVRLDARRPVDRDLGRGQDLESRRRPPAMARRSRSPRASSRRSTRRSDFRRTSIPTISRCACCATSRVSPDGKLGRLQRARQALRQGAARRRAASAWATKTRDSSSSRRGRVTGSRSSTRHGRDAEDGPRARRPRRRRGGPRHRRGAGPLHRAVVFARRPEDRVSPAGGDLIRGRCTREEPASTSSPDGRRRAASGARRRRRAGVRSHRHAPVLPRGRNEKTTLLSVACRERNELPARDEIEHVRSRRTRREFAPSPDGKWIAFEERFQTFVAPFPRTGRPMDIGPATQAYPVQRISRDAGFYLHWSGDSRQGVLGARSGAVLARSRARSPSSAAARRRPTSRRPRASPSASRSRATSRPASIALVGARVITMAASSAVRSAARRASSRTAPSSSRATASSRSARPRRCRCRPAPAASTSRARPSCRASSTSTRISAASRRDARRNRAGRSPPTWRSA